MFSKISRYRKLPDDVTIDADGFSFQSKSLRLIPFVDGSFQHTVEEVDRLDHLGYKYYKQPRKWWRICDANPDFPSPQALLGKEPIVHGEFPVEFDVSDPPYAVILAAVRNLVGVENALLGENDAGIMVLFNSMTTSAATIAATITASAVAEGIAAEDVTVSEMRNIGRVGKKIIIPPDSLV